MGGGYWMTLTASGITLHGQAAGWPYTSDSGTVRPWSTSILFTMVMSNSSRISDCARCAASSGWPFTTGTGRGPQPSSAGGTPPRSPARRWG